MSEYPIREDLQGQYECATRKVENFDYMEETDPQAARLIERIAKQDAEILEWKDRLRQMTEYRDDLNRLVAAKDAEIERLKEDIDRTNGAEHVAWLCYRHHHGRPTTIHVCDSDVDGAFKVYKGPSRYTDEDWVRLNRVFKSTSDKTISQDIKIESLQSDIERLQAENTALKTQVERLSAPVSDEEKAQFALHYVRLVQPDRQEPAMLVQNVNRFIASRAAKEKPCDTSAPSS